MATMTEKGLNDTIASPQATFNANPTSNYYAPQPQMTQPQMTYSQQPPNPQQQFQQAPQPQSQGHMYQTATPLQILGSSPAPVDCPSCGTRALTQISYHAGNTTL